MTPPDLILAARLAVVGISAILIVTGVALIYPPAALIVAGVAMAVVFLVDFTPRRRA